MKFVCQGNEDLKALNKRHELQAQAHVNQRMFDAAVGGELKRQGELSDGGKD